MDLSTTSNFNNFEFDDPIFSKHKMINLLSDPINDVDKVKTSSTNESEHNKANGRLEHDISIDLTEFDDDGGLTVEKSPKFSTQNHCSQGDRFQKKCVVLNPCKLDTSYFASDINSSILSLGEEGLHDLSSVIDSIVSCPHSNPALDL
uniref:Uncharacterized protein n=1 Tax=Lygus hesperus TaxID=30085 RepID=A0A0A9W4T1_LYGHE